MQIVTVMGIDLAKSVFHLHGVTSSGKVVVKKKLSREALGAFMRKLEPCLVGIEACGGANYWAREFRKMGHTVKAMAPQFVKPYRKNSKNDFNDAEAICEAVTRPNMRFVPIKEVEHQDMQSLHRVRSRLVASRTALVNEIRGILLEYGIILPKPKKKFSKALVEIIHADSKQLTEAMKDLMRNLYDEYTEIEKNMSVYNDKIEVIFESNEVCKRIAKVEGVGPITATAICASVSDAKMFKNGRQFAAWLGLVPGQDTTGGKEKLGGITKRGDKYIRQLLVHGGRSAILHASNKTDTKSKWMIEKKKTRGFNRASVAVANKNARVIWALMANGTEYRVPA